MIYRFLLITLVALGWAGCQDIVEFVPDPLPQPFNASVFVTVTDADGLPVDGASVELGNRIGQTNADGVLYLREVPMTAVSYARISKSGYFHGSRRFYPSAGKTHFISIILTPHTEAGSFSASSGGTITVDAGTQVIFPADAIADAQGNPYSGTVRVLAYAIHADDPELSDRMPGDLVGRSNESTLGALASLGMMAVEMTDPAGDPLRIRQGYQATLRMDIPAGMTAAAPSTIPMWYFAEDAGIWMEDGLAVRDGDAYVAEVSHFTYWNYDAWFPIVKWGATFVFEDGTPASQLAVCITILELETGKCAYTDNQGVVCGMVAAGEALLMEVKDPCGNVIYSQQIGPYNDPAMIGPITLPYSVVQPVHVSGLAVDCAGDPVTNGFVRVQSGGSTHLVELDPVSGAFSTSFINCQGADVTVSAIDADALKESLPITFPNAAVIDAGTITVCDQLTELIDLELTDFPGVHHYFFFPDVEVGPASTTLTALDSLSNQYFFVRVDATTTGTYTATGAEIGFWLPTGAFGYCTGTEIQFTEFGPPGGYIRGTITGTMLTQGGGPSYPMTGSFTVVRD